MDNRRKTLFGFGILIFLFVLSACIQANDPVISEEPAAEPTASETEPPVAITREPTNTVPSSTNTPATPMESTGTMAFSLSQQRLGNAVSFSVVVADVDLDHDQDIFFANYTTPSQLWLNDGNGNFSNSQQSFGSPPADRAHGAAIQDFNGDQYPDIFLVFHEDSSKVFFNDGSGGFSESDQSIVTSNDNPQDILAGDVDQDGDIDVFIVFSRKTNRLWLNDGNGYFERSEISFGDSSAHKMVLMDFDGDDVVDLFHCFTDKPGEVWINDGLGNFTDSGQAIGDQYGCDGVDSGDMDGDGDHDIVVANIEQGVRVWLNEENTGMFTAAGSYFDPGTIKFALLDADQDLDLDLVTATVENGNRLWRNEGNLSFTLVEQLFGTELAHCLTSGDLDGDGKIDLVIGSGSSQGSQEIYLNAYE